MMTCTQTHKLKTLLADAVVASDAQARTAEKVRT